MTDEDLRLLCASTVAAGQGSPVLIDLCASALDLLSRYYDVLGVLKDERAAHAAQPVDTSQFVATLVDTDTRATDAPPAPRKKLTKAQKKAKRNAYQRQYLARKRAEKKERLRTLADAIQAQAEEQAPTEQTDVAGTNSGAAPLPPR